MKKQNNGKLRIIPLGGLEQIGMNITAFEYEDSIVVVDCGLAFPEDDMLGIDLVIPDVTYLKDNASIRSRGLSSPTVTRITSARFRMCSKRSICRSIRRNLRWALLKTN